MSTIAQSFDVLDEREHRIGVVQQDDAGRWIGRPDLFNKLGPFDRPAEAVQAVRLHREGKRHGRRV